MIYFLFFLFLLNSYFYVDLLLPPRITLIYPPKRDFETYENHIFIKGYVDRRAEIYLNGELIPSKDGYFEREYYLKEGVNRFIIKAKKFWGQEKVIEVRINKLIR